MKPIFTFSPDLPEANQLPTHPSAPSPLTVPSVLPIATGHINWCLNEILLLARQIRPEVEYVEITHRFGNTVLYPVRYYAHMPNECCLGSSVPELLQDLTSSLSKEEV